jgi:hypothetical protein
MPHLCCPSNAEVYRLADHSSAGSHYTSDTRKLEVLAVFAFKDIYVTTIVNRTHRQTNRKTGTRKTGWLDTWVSGWREGVRKGGTVGQTDGEIDIQMIHYSGNYVQV